MYIQKLIKEQFSINDLDFSDDDGNVEYNNKNIFDKEIVNPQKIYDNILLNDPVSEYEIKYLNSVIAAVKPYIMKDLQTIINFYALNYKNESLNWIDVSEMTSMRMLFLKTKYNGDISKWNVSNVETMEGMFTGSYFNQDISNWDVSKVTNMYALFAETKRFNQDISGWDVSNVWNMHFMFYRSKKFNKDISNWNVDKVTDFREIFKGSVIKEEYKPEKFRV